MKNKQNMTQDVTKSFKKKEKLEVMDIYEPDEVIESSPNRKFLKLACMLGNNSYKKIFRAKQKIPCALESEPEKDGSGSEHNYEKADVIWSVVTVSSLDQELIDKNTYVDEIEKIKENEHPNIVRVIDSWHYDDDYVVITENMTEGSIKEYIKTNGFPSRERVIEWIRQILMGLQFLHSKCRVIHKNIKCSNVFLTIKDGKDIVKLGDLGISEAKFKNRMPVVGTPEFLPREIYEGSKYTEGVDIYCFGFFLIELCTGLWPYAECTDDFDLLKRVLLGQLPYAVHKIRDPCLKHLIFRCITSIYDRITVDDIFEHHIFTSEYECQGLCICEKPSIVLQLSKSNRNLQSTLISIQPNIIHLQLHLPESEQFIRFKFHNDKDTIDNVMSEMLEEEIIEKSMYGELSDLFKASIEQAKKIKSLNIASEGIFDVGMIEIKQIQLGETLILNIDQSYPYISSDGDINSPPQTSNVNVLSENEDNNGDIDVVPASSNNDSSNADDSGMMDNTVDIAEKNDKDTEIVLNEPNIVVAIPLKQNADIADLSKSVDSTTINASGEQNIRFEKNRVEKIEINTNVVENHADFSAIKNQVMNDTPHIINNLANNCLLNGFEPVVQQNGGVHNPVVPSASEPTQSASTPSLDRKNGEDKKESRMEQTGIENFVNETASIVNRTSDIAKEWIKLLKEQEIDTVEDLKLLVEEDWDSLGLPVFAARAMLNTLYGQNKQPVKEKHQITNHLIPEYSNDLPIKEFIADVCRLTNKVENAPLWEAKLTNQEIRTVGEFKSLHQKDWNKLGLSVFCYRILKNVLNRKGRLSFAE